MKQILALLLVVFSLHSLPVQANFHSAGDGDGQTPPLIPTLLNDDKIGTFGGDWPFPVGSEADFPIDQMPGVWEVREADDGAYLFIDRRDVPETPEKPVIKVQLIDPCTIQTTAKGYAYEQDNALNVSLRYTEKKMTKRLRFKYLYETPKSRKPKMVLMVMKKGSSKTMEKYFPVSKIPMSDVVSKCETK